LIDPEPMATRLRAAAFPGETRDKLGSTEAAAKAVAALCCAANVPDRGTTF
jgi:hypothetical protein